MTREELEQWYKEQHALVGTDQEAKNALWLKYLKARLKIDRDPKAKEDLVVFLLGEAFERHDPIFLDYQEGRLSWEDFIKKSFVVAGRISKRLLDLGLIEELPTKEWFVEQHKRAKQFRLSKTDVTIPRNKEEEEEICKIFIELKERYLRKFVEEFM